jgi:hypothetical protein
MNSTAPCGGSSIDWTQLVNDSIAPCKVREACYITIAIQPRMGKSQGVLFSWSEQCFRPSCIE